MINTVKNTQSYACLSACLKSQSVVECRFSGNGEVADILAAEPQVSLISCEVQSGRVNYSGKLIITVAYADEEGKLCRIQKGAEFAHYADDESLAPAQSALCALACEKLTIKREGSSFVISAIVGADIKVYARKDREFLSEIEGACTDKRAMRFYSAVTFSGESEVEDDFDADSVVDVLIPDAQPLVLSCECGTGEITVTGEIYLSLLAMRQSLPVCLDRVIPFKAVVVSDDCSVGKNAQAAVEIKDLNVTAKVNEEHGKCEVNFTCNLAVSGVFFDVQETNAVCDAFCCDKQLALEAVTEECTPCVGATVKVERVSGAAASKAKLDYACLFRAAALPKAEYAYSRESNAVEGAITSTLIYEQNGEIRSTEITLPFSVSLKDEVKENQTVCVDAAVYGMVVKQQNEGEIEAAAVIKLTLYLSETTKCTYVCGAEEGEAVAENDCAVSVFIPEAGDGLWEISKKIRQSPQTVSECNPDLSFPLTGSERILVYRSK